MVGSRAAFVALNAPAFAEACFGRGRSADGRIAGCTAIFRFWEGGFVFYGGVIAATAVVVSFCRREGWSFWRLGDLAAPTLAVGHAFGRLGCFFAGCCFGKVSGAPWAVAFPRGSVAYDELQSIGVLVPTAPCTPPLHPTQLYEALGELAIFAMLLALRRRWRARASDTGRGDGPPPGGLILTYAGCYALLRFVVEIFRGDVSRRFLVEWTSPRLAPLLGLDPDQPILLSVSQLASVLIVIAVAAAMVSRRRGPGTRAL
jgi:phosphatidylglycerol:prolipoprotein diacylglycerol transferase